VKPQRLLALFLGGVLGGGSALSWAQSITISPSLTLSEEYDDNILLSPTDRQSDFVTSVSPGLRLAITDYPVTVTAAASVRAVYYARRSDLNSSTDNREGSLAIEFRPTPRLTASLTDTVVRSFDPAEVDPETGIITGRFASTRNILSPVVSYQLTPLTRVRALYAFSVFRSDSPLVEDSDTHEAGLSVEREFTPRTSGTLRYTFSRFRVEGALARDAHLPRVGLSYALSPTIRVSADAGPLFLERSDGSIESTVGGSLEYTQEFQHGRLAIAYDRSARLAGVIGEGVTSQSFTARVSLSFSRDATLRLESGVGATESPDTAVDFLVYTAVIRLDYRILRWLSLSGGYRYLRQDDRTGPLDLERNSVFLGLTASTDARVY
jgi:hypothetical protein